jgi:CPA2 family monovalent cation:H+ antiporter-2
MSLFLPLALLSSAAPPFLVESVVIVAAGALIAYVCHRLGLVPIVGFLAAGVVIGPFGLGLVRDREMVDAAAEIGVILLLFTIGIEFGFEKLARLQRLLFGGVLQVGLSTLLTALILKACGVALPVAIFSGFLVSLSSTAIVLKILSDRGESDAPAGQVGLGLLIFQDLAVIVMVLLLPMLAGTGGSVGGILGALAKAVALIAAVLLVARRLMPPLLERVQRTCSPELFLLTLIAICLGTAYLTSLAGVSLSLGAFLAGLLVSESRFSEHALGEILPLQILFSATFFVSVGMLLDLKFLLHHPALVLGTVLAVLAIKALTTGGAVAALGYRLPVAAFSGLVLAQIGEFSFVLERSGRALGLTPAGLGETGSQTFIAATVVLMVLTPPVTAAGGRLAAWLERRSLASLKAAARQDTPDEAQPEVERLENHVVVAGYGQAARRLVQVLKGSQIPFLVTTLNPDGAKEAEAQGVLVIRGDSSRQGFLQRVGIERAKMLVIADDDLAMTHRIAAVARPLNPTLRIVARTRFLSEAEVLAEAGGDRVVADELESLVGIFSDVLRSYSIPGEEIAAHEEAIRRGDYAAFRTAEPGEERPPAVVCRLGPDCLDTRTVTVRAGVPAEGSPIGGLGLADLGLTAVSLRRRARVWDDPPLDLPLAAGDEITLRGAAAGFAEAASLFRRDGEGGDLPAPRRRHVDTKTPVTLEPDPAKAAQCSHLGEVRAVLPGTDGCEECLAAGTRWVHLRVCMSCGHVGCCDTSQGKHATAHFHTAGHPVMRSIEPGESWGWCFADEVEL